MYKWCTEKWTTTTKLLFFVFVYFFIDDWFVFDTNVVKAICCLWFIANSSGSRGPLENMIPDVNVMFCGFLSFVHCFVCPSLTYRILTPMANFFLNTSGPQWLFRPHHNHGTNYHTIYIFHFICCSCWRVCICNQLYYTIYFTLISIVFQENIIPDVNVMFCGFLSFVHCFICPSLTYRIWLPTLLGIFQISYICIVR
jgi:hypothetical protein